MLIKKYTTEQDHGNKVLQKLSDIQTTSKVDSSTRAEVNS